MKRLIVATAVGVVVYIAVDLAATWLIEHILDDEDSLLDKLRPRAPRPVLVRPTPDEVYAVVAEATRITRGEAR